MSVNTGSFNTALQILRSKFSLTTEEQAQRLWSEIEKYNSLTDLKEDIQNALDAVLYERKKKRDKQMASNAMDEEYPIDRLIKDLISKMQSETFKDLNPFKNTNVPDQSRGNETNQASVAPHHVQKTSNLTEKTHDTKFMVAKHMDAWEEKGQIIKSVNEGLNFQYGRDNGVYLDVKKIKSDYTRNNFLYVKPQHFKEAFLNRLLEMETKLGAYLDSIGKRYERVESDKRSFDIETIIIGRLTMDEDDSFLTERVRIEYVTRSGALSQCFLNFTDCKGDFLLFPNAYVAVGVVGDFYDDQVAVRVNSIYEIDSHLDSMDNSPSPKRDVDTFANILVFKGPYTLNGNAYFGGFDMILHHVYNDQSVNCVVLIGPFLPIEQVTETQAEFETKNPFEETRRLNFEHLLSRLSAKRPGNKPISVVIVPDASEVDNIYPSPIPNPFQNQPQSIKIPNPELVTFASSPCLLRFEIGQNNYNVAFSTQDIVKACARAPSKSSDPRKFLQPMRSLVSQKCLLPIFPYVESFDVTMIDQLNYDDFEKPDVIVQCSVMTHFACKARGTLVCNPKTIFEGNEFGTFARISLDASTRGIDGVRVDILKF